MWELLKKIAELGWKPYGKDISELSETEKHIRLLTSRSSGLWQFVCENGMVKETQFEDELGNVHYHKWSSSKGNYKPACNYEYRLIESALLDEDKLEEFLLSNIKIKGEKQKHS